MVKKKQEGSLLYNIQVRGEKCSQTSGRKTSGRYRHQQQLKLSPAYQSHCHSASPESNASPSPINTHPIPIRINYLCVVMYLVILNSTYLVLGFELNILDTYI